MSKVYLVEHINGQVGELLQDIRTEFGRILLVYLRKGKEIFDSENVVPWMVTEIKWIKLDYNYPFESIRSVFKLKELNVEMEIK